jgi:hypothetical protein
MKQWHPAEAGCHKPLSAHRFSSGFLRRFGTNALAMVPNGVKGAEILAFLGTAFPIAPALSCCPAFEPTGPPPHERRRRF